MDLEAVVLEFIIFYSANDGRNHSREMIIFQATLSDSSVFNRDLLLFFFLDRCHFGFWETNEHHFSFDIL